MKTKGEEMGEGEKGQVRVKVKVKTWIWRNDKEIAQVCVLRK